MLNSRMRLVGFTVGRGFRAPDLLQLYDVDINNVAVVGDRVTGYAIVGNTNLKASTIGKPLVLSQGAWSTGMLACPHLLATVPVRPKVRQPAS